MAIARARLTRRQLCSLPLALGAAGLAGRAAGQAQTRPYVLLLGAPAAGKTTHAKHISDHYGVPAIFAAEVMERYIADRVRVTGVEDAQTQLQRMRQTLEDLKQENLVSDAALNAILSNRIRLEDCADGFALDGYPNDVDQAGFFHGFVSGGAVHPRLDADELSVVYLDVPDDVALERMGIRQRTDDKWQFAKERLKVFRRNVGPLLDYYKGSHFFKIQTLKPQKEVAADIRAFLDKRYA